MKTALITGSKGFIGKNLRASLKCRENIRLLCFDRQDDPAVLDDMLDQADFVFHLAGVNRPEHVDEFRSGNKTFTEQICTRLSATGKKTSLLISSSIQATHESHYGTSKKGAEDALFAYSRKSGAPVYVYRLPNVFGKWCRPNYNSAVATFCHNIANNLPIHVNDPHVVMTLVYIDDVVSSFLAALDSKEILIDGFCQVQPERAITLGEIAQLIRSFKATRKEKSIPDMSDTLTRQLYSTYMSYLPVNAFSYPLKMNIDDRGSFTELIRTPDRGQVSANITKPGITKGNHWHHTKTEKFMVVSGKGVIRFRCLGSEEIIDYQVSGENLEVVDIPTGYIHNISNVGSTDLITIMWSSETFNPENPDTYFEQV